MKVVVFDLDETLGYFTQLGSLWNSLLFSSDRDFEDPKTFEALLDLYPEYLRPNILQILHYLNEKKKQSHLHQILLYTNNQGPKAWAQALTKYFETKLQSGLFDKLIAAFKVNGQQVELGRTTHEKTYEDLIRCTQLPRNTEFFFLDDVYHPQMCHDNVYYINIQPYVHMLPVEELVNRFSNSLLGKAYFQKYGTENPTKLRDTVAKMEWKTQKKNPDESIVDTILSKKILEHLQTFFEWNHQEKEKEKEKFRPGPKNTLKRKRKKEKASRSRRFFDS